MIGKLLFKGMIAGIIAGVAAFAFAHHFGEPLVDRAISFEESISAHQHEQGAQADHHQHTNSDGEEEVFSRQTQSGVGLLAGMVLLGAALGGGLSLAWTFSYQRVGPSDPRALALCLALGGFLILSLLPGIKYPPNPPAVGNPDTIGYRTALYFIILLLSAAIIAVAVWSAQRLRPRVGAWNAALWAALIGVALLLTAYSLLPAVNEVPDHFSADLLWRFRMSSFGSHFVMWSIIGLMFGVLAESTLPAKQQNMYFEHS